MLIELTERERLIILFELEGALESINRSLQEGVTDFAGDDESIMLLIAKLQDKEN